jgi:hypothetical protein
LGNQAIPKPITKVKNTVLGKDVEYFKMKVLETEA